MAIYLNFKGNICQKKGHSDHPPDKSYWCLGFALNRWKDNLPFVLSAINRNKPNYKSQMNELLTFFTTPQSTVIPQYQDKLFRFKIGDRVRLNLSKAERTNLGFKYSLYYGIYFFHYDFKPYIQ